MLFSDDMWLTEVTYHIPICKTPEDMNTYTCIHTDTYTETHMHRHMHTHTHTDQHNGYAEMMHIGL